MDSNRTYSGLSQEEFDKLYERIKSDVLKGLTPVEEPLAVILGGQPGSGKSNIYDIYGNECVGNIAKKLTVMLFASTFRMRKRLPEKTLTILEAERTNLSLRQATGLLRNSAVKGTVSFLKALQRIQVFWNGLPRLCRSNTG